MRVVSGFKTVVAEWPYICNDSSTFLCFPFSNYFILQLDFAQVSTVISNSKHLSITTTAHSIFNRLTNNHYFQTHEHILTCTRFPPANPCWWQCWTFQVAFTLIYLTLNQLNITDGMREGQAPGYFRAHRWPRNGPINVFPLNSCTCSDPK